MHLMVFLCWFISASFFSTSISYGVSPSQRLGSIMRSITLSYIGIMRTYERTMQDGTCQQLHAASDIHPHSADCTQQINDLIQHMHTQKLPHCFAITENSSCASYSPFLFHLPRVMTEKNIAHIPIEFRAVSFPGWSQAPNMATINDMLNAFEHYAAAFKHDAIAKGILTESDFLHLAQLREKLTPHLHTRMYDFWTECGFDGLTLQSWYATYFGSTLVNDINRVSSKLIEDSAFYHIQTSNKPSLYVNMGRDHIERGNNPNFIDQDLHSRLEHNGWRLIKTSGVTDKRVDHTTTYVPVNVAEHLARLPVESNINFPHQLPT